jgi:hypothetical protein
VPAAILSTAVSIVTVSAAAAPVTTVLSAAVLLQVITARRIAAQPRIIAEAIVLVIQKATGLEYLINSHNGIFKIHRNPSAEMSQFCTIICT